MTLRNIEDPNQLQQIPANVTDLTIIGCRHMVAPGALPKGLQTLKIEHCEMLMSLEGTPEGLKELSISGCGRLLFLERAPTSLQALTIKRCPRLTELPILPELEILKLDSALPILGWPVASIEEYQAICLANLKKKSANG